MKQIKNNRPAIKVAQIRKYCTSNISMLDAEIHLGSLNKAQIEEAQRIISGLYSILRSDKLIEQIGEQCVVQPRLVVVKFHNGKKRRRVHQYVKGIPEAITALGIF